MTPLYKAFMIFPPGWVETKNVPIDGGDDGYGAEHQREQHGALAHVDHDETAQQHGRDQRNGIGFEQIGGHARAVADIVADVVGNDGGIARIVLGNAGFDFTDQIRTDIRALGENAAAQAREYGDQRAAEGETDQRAQRRFGVARQVQHGEVIPGHPQQSQTDDQHAGDGAAAERDFEGGVDAVMGGLSGAHVRAHGDEHADVAGESGQKRADRKAAGRGPAQGQAENDEQDHADHRDGGVLTIQVGAGPGLYGGGDLLHAGIAGGLGQDPAHGRQPVENRYHTRAYRQPKRVVERHRGFSVGGIYMLLKQEKRRLIPQTWSSAAAARGRP